VGLAAEGQAAAAARSGGHVDPGAIGEHGLIVAKGV
jgi:hypothetical protein